MVKKERNACGVSQMTSTALWNGWELRGVGLKKVDDVQVICKWEKMNGIILIINFKKWQDNKSQILETVSMAENIIYTLNVINTDFYSTTVFCLLILSTFLKTPINNIYRSCLTSNNLEKNILT